MSDFHRRNIGRTCTYQCDDCGAKAPSKPMPPPPALGVFGLPPAWELGVSDIGDSPLYCPVCAIKHPLAKDASN
jgi:hypothetical protein